MPRRRYEDEEREKVIAEWLAEDTTCRLLEWCAGVDVEMRRMLIDYLEGDRFEREKNLGDLLPVMRRNGVQEEVAWVFACCTQDAIAAALLKRLRNPRKFHAELFGSLTDESPSAESGIRSLARVIDEHDWFEVGTPRDAPAAQYVKGLLVFLARTRRKSILFRASQPLRMVRIAGVSWTCSDFDGVTACLKRLCGLPEQEKAETEGCIEREIDDKPVRFLVTFAEDAPDPHFQIDVQEAG